MTDIAAQRVIFAGRSSGAGIVPARLGADLAVSASPTAWTAALIVPSHGDISSGQDGVVAGVARLVGMASATVEAGLAVAVQERDLTVSTSETGCAGTGVAALAGIEASAAVVAGLVVRAEIEVLVAEQATPALVAEALPGFLAAAMKTARVTDARVAEGTGPATLTPAKNKEHWKI